MIVADMKAPPNYWDGNARTLALLRGLATPRSKYVWLPIIAFLVEHPDRGPIVIDTGFDPSVAEDPSRSLGRAGARIFSPIRMTAAGPVSAQLRARGIDPTDVGLVVMTHLHFDHASGIGQFPNAEFVVERREHAAAAAGLRKGYVPSHLGATSRWRLLDVASAPPGDGFDHAHDLLGDGSVRLVFTPGHTDGHCSVLLETATGPLLLTADAAYAQRTLDERLVPLLVTGSRQEYRSSLEQLAAWSAAHPGAPVICGHDPWNRDALARDY
jgi:glyoxylase-like metal-dependent hydrolase (beta-lactamase superfamily II)